MLQAVGFDETHLIRTRQPLQSRLIVARKPGTTKSVHVN
jgi:hypothetical protein